MCPRSKIWILPTALLLIPSAALAQHSFAHVRLTPPPRQVVFMRPVARRQPMPVAPRILRIGNTGNSSATQGSSLVNSNFIGLNGAPINIDQLLEPSPSFGFSYEHLNAVNPDLGIKAFIDPITEDRLALAERLLRETPIAPISFFPFFDTEPAVMPEQQQPPIILLQQPQPAETASSMETQPPAPASTEESPLPPRDEGTFTLVLKDGTHISAVAFTRHDDVMVYITGEGLRRSFPIANLDKDATEKVNEDQGISLQLPQ
jgi:hypothetical protein